GKVTNYELTARTRDGKLTVVSYNATTFHDRDRVLQGVFASARDMTELKRFEQTLQQKNVELEEASRMKSEFLANMSHELRTPLNAIIGFSELLKDGVVGDLSVQQSGFIGDIFNAGSHLLSLINDILDLSKVEAGKMELDLEPVPIAALFANSLSIIAEKAAERNIRLELEAGSDLGAILMDVRKVQQILYNLLSNAVKFTDDGGRVVLRAERVPGAEVGQTSGSWVGRSFAARENEYAEFLRISVSDDGIGISEEDMERLFQPFSQIDSGLARKFEGTGLGLAMVKLLTELHGGAITMESAPGEGSCVTIWLPVRRTGEEALASGGTAAIPPATISPVTIPPSSFPPGVAATGARTALVVEDDMRSAELLRVQLETQGFTVVHAASAEAALVLALQQPVSLIILDIMLPRMNGWEFLALIKESPDLRRIPVVIVSIVADPGKGFSLGAAAVLQKPISRQALHEALMDLDMLPLAKGHSRKILIVDDDPAVVALMAVHVESMASIILRADGGLAAIEMARRELPDLILLDLMMPYVSGFDVVDALHQQPDTAGIPIVVVTAKEISADDRARLNGYVTAIVEKAAFDPGQFTDEVRRAMSGRALVV
ncbi:MAG TPA: response regulator, partial [Longimicrobiaceae bacterium]|nr:response regulator [Longimicrobiaceae bacterium]